MILCNKIHNNRIACAVADEYSCCLHRSFRPMNRTADIPRLHSEKCGWRIPPSLRPQLNADKTMCTHVYNCGDIYQKGSCGHTGPLCMGCGTCRKCSETLASVDACISVLKGAAAIVAVHKADLVDALKKSRDREAFVSVVESLTEELGAVRRLADM